MYEEHIAEGRISYLSLSPTAVNQTLAAWNRIYVTDPADTDAWALCVGKSQADVADQSVIKLYSNVFAVPASSAGKFTTCLRFDWRDQALPEHIAQSDSFAGVIESAERLFTVLEKIAVDRLDVTTRQAQAIRFLVLHCWRRIALKDAAWLHMKHVPDSAVSSTRTAVHKLFDAIPSPRLL